MANNVIIDVDNERKDNKVIFKSDEPEESNFSYDFVIKETMESDEV